MHSRKLRAVAEIGEGHAMLATSYAATRHGVGPHKKRSADACRCAAGQQREGVVALFGLWPRVGHGAALLNHR